ncbi:hypothetical protein NDU88_006596 [Pleurodeles waltl]|uniref:Uncharacterized protein n=1 Tax=Pleurodeles waltl TaxID=8319 RepID=A0AAV7UMY6_PLEWA|nr:hypothetical protein NDU88_006596 [Pleurodeles waltl]
MGGSRPHLRRAGRETRGVLTFSSYASPVLGSNRMTATSITLYNAIMKRARRAVESAFSAAWGPRSPARLFQEQRRGPDPLRDPIIPSPLARPTGAHRRGGARAHRLFHILNSPL